MAASTVLAYNPTYIQKISIALASLSCNPAAPFTEVIPLYNSLESAVVDDGNEDAV